MPTRVPTDTVAFDVWQDRICTTFVPLNARADADEQFRGSVSAANLGAVVMAHVVASPAVVERTARLIRRRDPQRYCFALQLAGRSTISQDGRCAVLLPGELAVCDTSRPYTFRIGEDFAMVLVSFPKSLMRVSQEQMTTLTAAGLPGRDGLGGLVASLMRELLTLPADTRPTTAAHLGDAVVDLVNALLYQQLRSPDSPDRAHRVLVADATRFIDEHLGDGDLSSAGIADAHFVSVRTLQQAFAAEGLSVASTIRARRLERCRRDLTDPARHDVPIAVIGRRWGLSDPAYFSRAFRNSYGHSPREFRKASHDGQPAAH
jgi:AraC-like DNA-binding protein